MKKLFLILLIFIGIANSANAFIGKKIDVDGQSIRFPLIDYLTTAEVELVEFLNRFQPPGSEIIAAYVTPEDWIRFQKNEEPTFTKFIQITTTLNDGKDIPYSRFEKDVTENKLALKEVEETISEVNAALLKQDGYISSLAGVELKNVVLAVIPFPVLVDNKNIFAATTLVIKKKSIDGQTTKTGRIMTTVLIYINNRILSGFFYSNMEEGNDIISHEVKVKNWLADFLSVNES